jgi:uncharacterized membrane protein SpoIIM required for sporulation
MLIMWLLAWKPFHEKALYKKFFGMEAFLPTLLKRLSVKVLKLWRAIINMVIESIFSPSAIINAPKIMLPCAIIISLISIYISFYVFPSYSGIIAPLFITMALSPLLVKIFTLEEEIERLYVERKISESFFERHSRVIELFALFFVGNLIAFLIVAMIVSDNTFFTFFGPQLNEISAIQSITGALTQNEVFQIILINNVKVMVTSFILSLVFGSGAVFILSWNASILAGYLGIYLRTGALNEFLAKSMGIAPHAPFEIGAYFIAGIAGGMLSAGFVKENWKSREFRIILKDSIIMMLMAIAVLVIGALLEVYL